jgi:hypothetical protein
VTERDPFPDGCGVVITPRWHDRFVSFVVDRKAATTTVTTPNTLQGANTATVSGMYMLLAGLR